MTKRSTNTINIAIVGVGNCASSLLQGLAYYRQLRPKDPPPPGVMHSALGGYPISAIKPVAAFDIDVNKVGRPLAVAMFAPPNNTIRFASAPEDAQTVTVRRGMTHDGIGEYLRDIVHKAPGESADVQRVLREARAEILVNYLPVGSDEATKWYIELAEAGNLPTTTPPQAGTSSDGAEPGRGYVDQDRSGDLHWVRFAR
jgi:myo-inositol-1-phosphate synthase